MSRERKDSHSIGSTLRDRGKKPPADIGDIWTAQEILEIENRKDRKPVLNIKKHIESIKKTKAKLSVPKINIKFNKKYTAIIAGVALVFIVRTLSNNSSGDGTPEHLGASTQSTGSAVPSAPALTAATDTEFDLLWPVSSKPDETEVVKVSPPDNDPVYAYISVFNGAELRISQQEIPEEFVSDVPEKVKEVAESFQARDVIQVDDVKIYHGFTEKNGGVQSLVFEKNGVLVLVASPVKFSDTQWASFVSALK